MNAIFNQRGESLITALCSIAITTVMMAGASAYIYNFSVSNRHLRMSLESTQFARETEHILSRGSGCLDSLAGKILPALTTKTSMPKLTLAELVQDGEKLAAAGTEVGETGKIQQLFLAADRELSATDHIASLNIQTVEKSGTFAASRKVKLSVQTDTTRRITACKILGGTGDAIGGTCPGDRMVDGNNSLQMLGTSLPPLPEGQLTQQLGTPVNGCNCRMGLAPNSGPLWHCISAGPPPNNDSP